MKELIFGIYGGTGVPEDMRDEPVVWTGSIESLMEEVWRTSRLQNQAYAGKYDTEFAPRAEGNSIVIADESGNVLWKTEYRFLGEWAE